MRLDKGLMQATTLKLIDAEIFARLGSVEGWYELIANKLGDVSVKCWLAVLLLLAVPVSALAEGGCPPGQYPIGGQGVVGCAPIPGSGGASSGTAAQPTGKWETRWGAIVEDQKPDPNRALATGYSVSQNSKRAAVRAATDQCRAHGGTKCVLRIAYYDQCVALADPEPVNGRIPAGLVSSASHAATLEQARAMAMENCQAGSKGLACVISYSACSMSEFVRY